MNKKNLRQIIITIILLALIVGCQNHVEPTVNLTLPSNTAQETETAETTLFFEEINTKENTTETTIEPTVESTAAVTSKKDATSEESTTLVSETEKMEVANTKASTKPTAKPTTQPTAKATVKPTAKPTTKPTAKPTTQPTAKPTSKPTTQLTTVPTAAPTAKSTSQPTVKPIVAPTAAPTPKPSTPLNQQGVLKMVNKLRAEYGVAPLRYGDSTLQEIANIRAGHQTIRFGHKTPPFTYTDPDTGEVTEYPNGVGAGSWILLYYGDAKYASGELCAGIGGMTSAEEWLEFVKTSQAHVNNMKDPDHKTMCAGFKGGFLVISYGN
jgi:uncharacterized protein YkwD